MATVLIVDDDPYIRQMLCDLMLDLGHHVLSAADGRAALKLAHEHQLDLIISDVMMPGLDGYGLLAALRADPRFAHTAVFLMSAIFSQKSVSHPPDGATGVIAKPFDLLEVERMLQRLAL